MAVFRSLSFDFWHRAVIASSAFKTASVVAEQELCWYLPPETAFETSAVQFVNASSIV